LKNASSDRRGVASLQDALRSFLTESGIGARLRPSAVFEAWNHAAGDALAAHARPVRFRRGELCVEVDSAAHHHELKNFTGEKLRASANERLARAGGADPVDKRPAREQISRIVFRLKR
jgi:predicted nucleic acid-binding Zn ribbon protein